jgi:hypothetical protein
MGKNRDEMNQASIAGIRQPAKKKQSTVPHPFRVTLRNGWETRNL